MIHPRLVPVAFVAGCSFVSFAWAQNAPPLAPVITEPQTTTIVSPYDVHMETAPFVDPNPGDLHAASDWEIWSVSPSALAWRAAAVTGIEKSHAHLGDGVFQGAHAGWGRLFASTVYQLRARHMDNSGVAATQWSAWSIRQFTTTANAQIQALELDDIAAVPVPVWTDPNGQPVDLPVGTTQPSLRLETATGQLLLRIDAAAGPGNAITNPGSLAQHDPVRVVINAGVTGGNLVLPETNLAFAEHGGCHVATIRLPALTLAATQSRVFWVSIDGATYLGTSAQTTPTFTSPARNLLPPYVVREAGYRVDIVAQGFQLPVNIAFVPGAGTAPGDAKFYVTELYGTVKTVTNNGTVLNYATNLLNYVPSGSFPGDGEQGLTGIAVDPVTKDVFVSLLRLVGTLRYPRILRLSSTNGGLSAATQVLILDMPGESQGQSHQISRLEIVAGQLYCHMGDGFTASTARSLTSYRGKILRLNLDGSPVVTNPFYNGGTVDARDYVFALGVRNPFGGAWRAADNSRYVVENGPSIDRFAKIVMGRDYLWAGADADMLNYALYNWQPSTGPVNLAFVQPQTFSGSGFPVGKMDHAFVTESGPTYAEGRQTNGKRITEWVLNAAGNLVQGPIAFVEYVGDGRATMVGLAAGPDGLYFTDLYRDLGATGPSQIGARVIRVSYGAVDDCNVNGEADWCEIATGAVTDFDHDNVPDVCNLLAENRDRLSAVAGGTVDFTLRAGAAHGGRIYLVLGTLSGTVPGQPAGALHLPLNNDFWFGATLSAMNSSILVNTYGSLDVAGNATAALVVPPNLIAALLGMTAHHAYVVFDQATSQFTLTSNAVPLLLEL